MYFTRLLPVVNSDLRFLKLGVASSLSVPDASDFDAFVPVMVEDMNHCFGSDDIDFSTLSSNKFAICGEIAGIDFGDFYVLFEDLHVYKLA